MKNRIFEGIALTVVVIGGALAFYLQKPVVPVAKAVTPSALDQSYHVLEDDSKSTKVGFVGETRSNEKADEPFNKVVLEQVLQGFNKNNVDAVFFLGNLVEGASRYSQNDVSTVDLKKQLEKFSDFVEGILGSDEAIFPVLGNREMVIPHGGKIFAEHFNLKNIKTFDDDFFAYTVTIGKAFFAVVPTDENHYQENTLDYTFKASMIAWLQVILPEAAKEFKYLFVVGHEPAFPVTSTFSDPHSSEREAFWNVLVANGVVAYFSSHEHVFDRSNRHGVWQIITGGGGAAYREGGAANKPFFHSLLLEIPVEEKKVPSVQVLDLKGQVIDEFELTQKKSALIYERHISLK